MLDLEWYGTSYSTILAGVVQLQLYNTHTLPILQPVSMFNCIFNYGDCCTSTLLIYPTVMCHYVLKFTSCTFWDWEEQPKLLMQKSGLHYRPAVLILQCWLWAILTLTMTLTLILILLLTVILTLTAVFLMGRCWPLFYNQIFNKVKWEMLRSATSIHCSIKRQASSGELSDVAES